MKVKLPGSPLSGALIPNPFESRDVFSFPVKNGKKKLNSKSVDLFLRLAFKLNDLIRGKL